MGFMPIPGRWEDLGAAGVDRADQSDGSSAFQVNAGIRIRGGYSRSTGNPKHGFRFFFRDQYGDAKLNFRCLAPMAIQTLDSFDLRTFENYSWSFEGNSSELFLQDQLMRDAQLAMGEPGSTGNYYNLYINGQYFGISTPMSGRRRRTASYFGGTPDDYDVIKTSGDNGYNIYATDGNLNAWTISGTRCWRSRRWRTGRTTTDLNATYLKMQGLNPGRDAQSLSGAARCQQPHRLQPDQLLRRQPRRRAVELPGEHQPNNIFMIRNRNGNEGWKFIQHDAEHTMRNVGEDRTGPFYMTPVACRLNKSNPQSIFEILELNPEFRLAVADRIRKWMFNDGVLRPAGFLNLFNARKERAGPRHRRRISALGRCEGGHSADARHLDYAGGQPILNNYIRSAPASFLGSFRRMGFIRRWPRRISVSTTRRSSSGTQMIDDQSGRTGNDLLHDQRAGSAPLWRRCARPGADLQRADQHQSDDDGRARIQLADGSWSAMTESTLS
jgi:hypothetical protein